MSSVGHRLKVLRNVYEIKVKQNIPLDPEDFVPPCKCFRYCFIVASLTSNLISCGGKFA